MTGTLNGHFVLDEDSGTTAYDYSGNGNDGTLNGGAGPSGTGTVTGPFGNSAYDFDGIDDYVEIGEPAGLNSDSWSVLTVSVWVRVDTLQQSRVVVKGEQGLNANFRLGLDDTGVIYVYLDTASGTISSNTTIPYSTGEWFHITLTYDGGTAEVYKNGVSELTNTTVGGQLTNTSASWVIGAFGQGDSALVNGAIADVRIYNRSLSPQEVQYLYQAGVQSEAIFEVQQ